MIAPDTVSIIIAFLPLSDCFSCRQVNSSWNHVISHAHFPWIPLHHHLFKFLKSDHNQNDHNESSSQSTMHEILNLFLSCPRKQQMSSGGLEPVPFLPNSLENMKWESTFHKIEGSGHYGNTETYPPAPPSYYKFFRPIPKEELKSHYLMCIVYEIMTLGDYTPKFTDLMRTKLSDNGHYSFSFEFAGPTVPFCSLLMMVKHGDYSQLRSEAAELVPSEENYYKTYDVEVKNLPQLVKQAILTNTEQIINEEAFYCLAPNFSISPNVEVEEGFMNLDHMDELDEYSVSDQGEMTIVLEGEGYEGWAPRFFNAGGGCSECVEIKCSIDETCQVVTMERKESRHYY